MLILATTTWEGDPWTYGYILSSQNLPQRVVHQNLLENSFCTHFLRLLIFIESYVPAHPHPHPHPLLVTKDPVFFTLRLRTGAYPWSTYINSTLWILLFEHKYISLYLAFVVHDQTISLWFPLIFSFASAGQSIHARKAESELRPKINFGSEAQA